MTAKKAVPLTNEEKSIIKALLNSGMEHQDIQFQINLGREATINSGRIAEIKQDSTIVAADKATIARFKKSRSTYDHKTGLNSIDHERLIRAREAMILAVQIFNNPAIQFKSAAFSMFAHVAWTYLLHEYHVRQGTQITNDNGQTIPLSTMLTWSEPNLSKAIKDNLKAIKILRDKAEHKLLGCYEKEWFPLFQACALNFEKTICKLFGNRLTLAGDLSFALQFAKLDIEQASILQSYDIPEHIQTMDAELCKGMTEEEIANPEYQFKVVYTLTSSSKSGAHFQFIGPDTAKGKDIHKILIKPQPVETLYPYKPTMVVEKIRHETTQKFSIHDHTKAWQKHKIRPPLNAPQPETTNRDYCYYSKVHKTYTYSDKWVNLLTDQLKNNNSNV